MAYRDELEAARARVAILERQLADSGQDQDARERAMLAAERDALKAEAEALTEQSIDLQSVLSEAVAHGEALAAELDAVTRSKVPAPSGTPTLTDHNRRFAPVPFAKPSGVRCPLCAVSGDDVEMMRGGPFLYERSWRDGQSLSSRPPADTAVKVTSVLCPRCSYFGSLRLE